MARGGGPTQRGCCSLRKSTLRRENDARRAVSYGIPSKTLLPASDSRRKGPFIRDGCYNVPPGVKLTPKARFLLPRAPAPRAATPSPPHTRPHTLPHRRLHPTDTIRFPAFVFLAAGVVSPLPATTTCGATAASSLASLKAPSNRLGPKFLLVCRKVFLGVARCRFWSIVCSRSNVGASGNERRATC